MQYCCVVKMLCLRATSERCFAYNLNPKGPNFEPWGKPYFKVIFFGNCSIYICVQFGGGQSDRFPSKNKKCVTAVGRVYNIILNVYMQKHLNRSCLDVPVDIVSIMFVCLRERRGTRDFHVCPCRRSICYVHWRLDTLFCSTGLVFIQSCPRLTVTAASG